VHRPPYGRVWLGAHALVRLRPGALPSALGLVDLETLSAAWGVLRVRAPGLDGEALARHLAAHPAIAETMPDYHLPRRPSAIDIPPNDPRYGGQWYLDRLGMEEAWRLETGDPGVAVVIVDNGCELDHPDLRGAFAGGIDVVDGDDDASFLPESPGNEHGTACAGIIGARADNGEGIAGVCPGCSLHCVRMLAPPGMPVPISADVRAFEYARSVGAAVVSNSWGYVEAVSAPPMLAEIIEALHDEGRDGRGTLVLFSAGNDSRALGDEEITGLRGVVTVGAVTLFDDAAPFSNFGASVDLTAPTGTLTTDLSGADGENDSDYTSLFGGTSSSCPVAAGVAGLLFSAAPEATAAEVGQVLRETAEPAPFASPDADGHDPLYGYGILDPVAALREITGATTFYPEDAGRGSGDDGGDGSGPGLLDAGPEGATPGRGGCAVRARGGDGHPGAAIVAGLAALALRARRSRGGRLARARGPAPVPVPAAVESARERSKRRRLES